MKVHETSILTWKSHDIPIVVRCMCCGITVLPPKSRQFWLVPIWLDTIYLQKIWLAYHHIPSKVRYNPIKKQMLDDVLPVLKHGNGKVVIFWWFSHWAPPLNSRGFPIATFDHQRVNSNFIPYAGWWYTTSTLVIVSIAFSRSSAELKASKIDRFGLVNEPQKRLLNWNWT